MAKCLIPILCVLCGILLAIQYLCSVSPSFLKKRLKWYMVWLEKARPVKAKDLKEKAESALKDDNVKSIRDLYYEIGDYLKRVVPCFQEPKRKKLGPDGANCTTCTMRNYCIQFEDDVEETPKISIIVTIALVIIWIIIVIIVMVINIFEMIGEKFKTRQWKIVWFILLFQPNH